MTPADRMAITAALIAAALGLVGLAMVGWRLPLRAMARYRAAAWAAAGALVVLAAQLLALLSLSGNRATVLGGLIGFGGLLVALMLAVAWALRLRYLLVGRRRNVTKDMIAEVERHLADAAQAARKPGEQR